MKNSKKTIYTIAAAVIIIIFAACDVLVAPIKGRNNPVDEENPVPPAVNFSAELFYNEGRFVGLSWNDGETNSESNLEGYLIVRKKGSPPETIWDGDVVERIDFGNQTYNDDSVESDSYPKGWRVYYSIFSFGGKWEDMNEDDKLNIDFTEEGAIIRNYENYNFTGPVSDSVVVSTEERFYVRFDGYMTWDYNTDNYESWNTDLDTLIVDDNYYNGSYDCRQMTVIEFDCEKIEGSKVLNAEMMLTTQSVGSGTMGIEINLLGSDWINESGSYFCGDDIVNSNYSVSVYDSDIPSAAPEAFYINITNIAQEWADGRSNFGVRIESDTGDYRFQSNEHSGEKPELIVTYYYE